MLLLYHSNRLLPELDALIDWIREHLQSTKMEEEHPLDDVMHGVEPSSEGDNDQRMDVCDRFIFTDHRTLLRPLNSWPLLNLLATIST
jgi:hypothetical protein